MSTASQTLEPDLSGQTLERYRLIRRLGIGGMGAVYEAEHTKLEKRVAVKVLRAEFTLQEIARKRFLREAKAASRVKHPNVVDISDFGETEEGRVYFAMELLAGKDLSDLIKAERRLPWERAQKILLQVVSALEAAHAQGIVHRDMKPSNCFLVDGPGMEGIDFIKVLDFGIAKLSSAAGEATEGLTSTDEVFGTVAYMAPEMAMGITNDPRSDIYAVGVMMYRMLVGELPFTEGNAFQILAQHINVPPPRPRSKDPSIPAAIEAVILKALEKRADDRFQTMKDLADAIRLGMLVETTSMALEATVLASTVGAAPGGTTVLPTMAAAPSDGPTVVSSTGRSQPLPIGPVHEPTGPTGSSGTMGVTQGMGPVQGTGPVQTSFGPVAMGPPRKASGLLIALLAVTAVGVVIGAVMLGMLLGDKGKDDGPPVVTASLVPGEPTAQQPSAAEPEVPVEPPELAPTADPARDTKEPSPSAAPEAVEAAASGDPAPAAEPADRTEPAPQAERGGSKPKTPRTAKPKTDDAVIAGLERKIVAQCSEGGGTSVRLEGLIRTDGHIQGALATPKGGPGACAVEILESARFATREKMKPMRMFSVVL